LGYVTATYVIPSPDTCNARPDSIKAQLAAEGRRGNGAS